jgi:hypothetical protein
MIGSTPATVTEPGSGTPGPGPWTWPFPSCAPGPTFLTGCWNGAVSAERALTTVVATCYLLGVSTRRMEKLVETLGITRLSKSQVSNMAKELDEHVADFRSRPLDAGTYTFVAADALVLKVREGGRVSWPWRSWSPWG